MNKLKKNFTKSNYNLTLKTQKIKSMAKKHTHGGKRKGAGRKPAPDPKQTLTIYVEQSIIAANNGIEEAKTECYLFLKERGNRI